jgi:hypothetical protein
VRELTQSAVRLIHCDEVVAVAESGPMCVVVWRGPVTTRPFERQRAGLASVVDRHADGAGFLCVVEPSAKAPDDALRRASSQMIQTHRDRLKCVACVIEGEGFKAAINRGALAGMALLLDKRKYHVGVYATVDQAIPWINSQLPSPSAPDLGSTVAYLRACIADPRKHCA